MDADVISQIRFHTLAAYRFVRARLTKIPPTALVVLGLFLLAAVFAALHTAFSAQDASLHLKVQHSFRSADLSVWIDGKQAYSGKLRGTVRRKLGLIPESVQGSLSQIFALSSGVHQIRIAVASDDGSAEEDSISAEFAPNSKRELSATARRSSLTLAWQSTDPVPAPANPGLIARYMGTLLLTIAGSIISAVTGFALKELPARIRSRQNIACKTYSASAGQ